MCYALGFVYNGWIAFHYMSKCISCSCPSGAGCGGFPVSAVENSAGTDMALQVSDTLSSCLWDCWIIHLPYF